METSPETGVAPDSTRAPQTSPRRWIGYVIPMAVYLALTALEGDKGIGIPYPWLYLFKIVVVTAILVVCRRVWSDIRFEARVLPAAILVGLAVFVEWVLLDKFLPYPHLGSRVGFNPWSSIPDSGTRLLFLVSRFYGLVLVVPLMEELFWRSFVLRWLTDQNFTAVPMGAFSWSAFWWVAAGFGFEHPEWLAAVLCAIAYGLLLRQTKSLYACIVAHAVTNLALGIYVVQFQAWRFW